MYPHRITIFVPMCDPTYLLRRWDHDGWPSHWLSNWLSLSDRVLENSVSDMNLNSISALYADFRSPSRIAQRDKRKRKKQRMLNPMFRTKHCPYHRDCLAFSKPQMASRQCRWRDVRAECTSEAYWNRECAELDLREEMESADLVTLYYNHGHNAAAIEALRPQPLESAQSEEGDEDENLDEWVSIPPTSNTPSSNLHPNPDPSITTPQTWTISLYPPIISPQPSYSAPETTFTFHRNSTGIWELGFANPDSSSSPSDPYGCTHLPLPLSCGCCSWTTGFFACSCADFPADWRSPEQPWRGSLIAWVGGDVVQRLRFADELQKVEVRGLLSSGRDGAGGGEGGNEGVRYRGSEEWTFVRAPRAKKGSDGDWDVVSELSSTGSWRVVDVA